MRKMLLFALLTLAACATTSNTTTTDPSRLETTPRHDEWVTIDSPGRPLHAYVVYPQSNRKAGAIVVIHENRGLTDWVRTVADKLAEEGYIAVAPDFLSGSGPNGGRTSDFPTSDAARLKEMGVAAVYTPKDFGLTGIMAGIVAEIRKARGLA